MQLSSQLPSLSEFTPIERRAFLCTCATLTCSIPAMIVTPEPFGVGPFVAVIGGIISLTGGILATEGAPETIRGWFQPRPRMQPQPATKQPQQGPGPMMEQSMQTRKPWQRTVQRQAATYVAPGKTKKGIDVATLVKSEYAAINATLAAHQIKAKISKVQNVRCAFISYRLAIAPGERIAKIDAIKRELSNALTTRRQKFGMNSPVKIRVSEVPLAIEVPHPDPAILEWSMRHVEQTPSHTMLLGQSCIDAPQIERVSFDDAPHILVVGITKAGKSVLEKMMLLSLCYNTSPDDLKIVLVDLKNEDMLPFAHLPHVLTFAGRHDQAMNAIRMVRDEKDYRIDHPGHKPYRLVLWIDELAQLAQNKEAKEILGDLASIGRSKDINLIAATQHPTQEGGMGALMKANFPLRLAGMVAPGQSHIATGRPQAGADMLPGKGSFLYCHGPDVYRLQSFHIDNGDAELIVRHIIEKWSSVTSKRSVRAPGPILMNEAGPRRDAIDDLADEIKALWVDGASKNAMAKHALGKAYAGSYAAKIDQAIRRLEDRHSTTTDDDPSFTRVRGR